MDRFMRLGRALFAVPKDEASKKSDDTKPKPSPTTKVKGTT